VLAAANSRMLANWLSKPNTYVSLRNASMLARHLGIVMAVHVLASVVLG
jgi:hypothetical protein